MVRSFFEGIVSAFLMMVGYCLIAFILSLIAIVVPLLVVSTSPNSLWFTLISYIIWFLPMWAAQISGSGRYRVCRNGHV